MTSQKTALVTGASSGLGAHFGRLLAGQGYHVLLAARRLDKVADLASQIALTGGSAEPLKMDVTNAASVDAAFEAMIRPPDVVINNAGVAGDGAAMDMTEEVFDMVIDTNLKGVFLVSQAAARSMKARGQGGAIVNIGSIFGETVPFPGIDLYSMTKFAMAGLTRAWARDLAEDGITVNCIQPGPINTDMNPEDGALAEAMLPRSPIGRYGRPEEIAEMVAYLCGPNTDNVTGSVLNNDGAWNA